MSPQDKQRLLVERLYSRTVEKKLSWVSAAGNMVVTSTSSASICVREGVNENAEPIIIIEIFNSEGELRDRFSDDDIKGAQPAGSFLSYYQMMRAIHATAGRQASGADKTLDDLLGDLEDLPS